MKLLPSSNTHRLATAFADSLCGRGGESQRCRLGARVPWISDFHPDLNLPTSAPASR